MNGLSRLLGGAGPGIDEYLDAGGYAGLEDYFDQGPGALHGAVAEAGLRGRGGSWRPVGGQWAHALSRPGPRFVVANGAASRPCHRGDHELMVRFPHLVVEGAILAGLAVDTLELFFYIGPPDAYEAVKRAVGEAGEEGFLNGELVELVAAPGGYLAGQETAAIEFIEHHEAEPRWTPPEATVWGVDGKATVVSNVETLAHLALMANHGAGWFREVGAAGCPGTMLLTLPDGCSRPGVVEVAVGTRLSELLEGAGRPVRAVQVGGPGSAWLAGESLSVPLDPESVAAAGSRLGGGAVRVLWEDECAYAAAARSAAFLADEACRKCPPCRDGSQALAAALSGDTATGNLEEALALAAAAAGKGACELGDVLAPAVESAWRLFPDDFAAHLGGGPCPRPGCRLEG